MLRPWIAAALLAAAVDHASAAGSVAVTLSATVVPVCKFFGGVPTLNLRNTGGAGSNIDPSSATAATGSASVGYRCTNGVTPTFSIPTSATVTCGACSGTPTMAATITSTNTGAGRGFQAGGVRNRSLMLTGSIPQAVFQNARAGAYSGTMTVTVNP